MSASKSASISASKPVGKTAPKRRSRPRTAPVPATVSQAHGHQRTRRDHQLEQAEDYVELVAALIAERGEARAVDMARSLGVSHVTVNRTLARLQRLNLIKTEPYRAVFLTSQGEALAAQSRERHTTVEDFLVAMGVSREQAALDAEGIEHHVSPETLEVFRRVAGKSRGAKS